MSLPAPVGAGLHYLVQHALGQVRLILLTRDEPSLPLWRYRLTDDLSELRAPDLAFTEAEAEQPLAGHGVGCPETRSPSSCAATVAGRSG